MLFSNSHVPSLVLLVVFIFFLACGWPCAWRWRGRHGGAQWPHAGVAVATRRGSSLSPPSRPCVRLTPHPAPRDGGWSTARWTAPPPR